MEDEERKQKNVILYNILKEKITTQNFDQLTFGPREKKSVQSKVHDVVQHYIPIYTGIQHNIFLYIPVFKKKESGCGPNVS
jgi:hypothetical protein